MKKVIDELQLGAKDFNMTSELFCLIFNICKDDKNEIFDETKYKPYEDPFSLDISTEVVQSVANHLVTVTVPSSKSKSKTKKSNERER